uniref:Alpha-aminoadipic semialdehyde synthase, mitochondrial-like n=1 Tax=Phallusia mammillata TaxID=59560 RepID=A0A6F9D4V5_9ASCI|nr:alpha-aminoadipic semialdehyde synthase, mitochondrial-like [Phallusia mammillata]
MLRHLKKTVGHKLHHRIFRVNVRAASSSTQKVIAIRREDNVVWERRAPLAPSHVRKLVQDGLKVLVQPANKRAFSVQEYVSAGAVVEEDLDEASIILGVKQVPIDRLCPDKTYVFFSHTIKAQTENMSMLDAVLEKKIRLIDYEKMEEASGKRVVAFGKFAGYAGMINILHGMGVRLLALGHHTPFMHIGISHNYRTSGQAIQAVRDAGYEISLGRLPESIGPLTFVFTGTGNVSQGAQEIFRELPCVYIEPHELKTVAEHGDSSMVYGCVVDMHDHLRRKNDGGFDMQEYFDHPELYESVFAKEIAPYASCIVNGIFWRPNDPRLLTTPDAVYLQDSTHSPKMSPLIRHSASDSPGCPRLPQRLIAIGDVSADPGGSIQFMNDCTSIDAPFEVYDASTNTTTTGVKGQGILMCSVDNLPAQLPREATQYFGDHLFPYIADIAKNDATVQLDDHTDISPVVKNATIASNGELTPKFKYIENMRKKREKEGAMYATSSKNHKVLLLGSGFVSGPVVEYLTSHKDTAVTVASAVQQELKQMSLKNKYINPVLLDVNKERQRLDELVKGHDLVVSLLPYTLHPDVTTLCIKHHKNMVTASYVSPPMRSLEQSAIDADISIVMEVGVDPGIDHMLAMECFDQIKNRDGEVSSFVSWCGGLPAPESSDNPLKYKFSWSPAGVLMVTLAPSRYLQNNQIIEIDGEGENYRKGVLPINFMPGFNLEGLPNRDSLKYKDEYGLDSAHTVMRGTLRYKGFAKTAVALLDLGLVNMDPHPLLNENAPTHTWKSFMGSLLGANHNNITTDELKNLILQTVDQECLQAIEGLGLLSDSPVKKAGNTLQALASQLSSKLPYEKGEKDVVILRHEIEGNFRNGNKETHNVDMVVYGDDGYTAMSKTVGYPCAIAARMMLLGKIEKKGLVTPLKSQIYQPLLKELRRLGIQSKTTVKTN